MTREGNSHTIALMYALNIVLFPVDESLRFMLGVRIFELIGIVIGIFGIWCLMSPLSFFAFLAKLKCWGKNEEEKEAT